MNNYQDELLTILMEECGETVQEICKIKRFGLDEMSHHIKDKTHRECLTQEMGDILAMIQMVVEGELGITHEALESAKNYKLNKVKKWMKYPGPITDLPKVEWDVFSVEPGSPLDVVRRTNSPPTDGDTDWVKESSL